MINKFFIYEKIILINIEDFEFKRHSKSEQNE